MPSPSFGIVTYRVSPDFAEDGLNVILWTVLSAFNALVLRGSLLGSRVLELIYKYGESLLQQSLERKVCDWQTGTRGRGKQRKSASFLEKAKDLANLPCPSCSRTKTTLDSWPAKQSSPSRFAVPSTRQSWSKSIKVRLSGDWCCFQV